MDHVYLKLALKEAATRRGFAAPNPAVGAVLARSGEVLARGAHWGCGHPHAEAVVLSSITHVPPDSTLYVTLEPCNHFGKTPPCTEMIRRCGVLRVVYGYKDPNCAVSGNGHQALEQYGIEVLHTADCEIDDFYRSYHHWLLTNRPWVTVKLAMSLDGKIAGLSGEPAKITGPDFDRFTHERRGASDAILTSARTLLNDNPRLDARLETVLPKRVYVVDRTLRLRGHPLRIFDTASELVVFHASGHGDSLMKARLVEMPGADRLDITQVLEFIGRDGVHDLWVEAGAELTKTFLDLRLWNEAFIAISGRTIGPGIQGPDLGNLSGDLSWKLMGGDAICHVRNNVYGNH